MAVTRERLRELVGLVEPSVTLRDMRSEDCGDYIIEYLTLRIGDTDVRGILTRPTQIAGRAPAILYGHSHGGRYDIGADELLGGREYLLDPPRSGVSRAGAM